MFFTPDIRLVRAEDHVVLDVSVIGLQQGQIDTPDGRRYVLTGSGQLRVRFGAQQILEYAAPAPSGSGTTIRARQDVPIYGPASDVVVTVAPASPPIELSVAGILDALGRYPLAVAAGTPSLDRAAPPTPRQRAQRAAAVRTPQNGSPPADGVRTDPRGANANPGPVTRIAFPRRLVVEVPGGPGPRLSHASEPVSNGGAVELWTSRYALLSTDPTEPPSEPPIPVGLGKLPGNPNPPLAVSDTLLVNTLTDANVDTFAARASAADPATMTDLALSGLGGWITLDGTWQQADPTLPPDRLRHETRQGRDQFQHNVLVGRLLPFGNLCVLTSTTVRKFETGSRRSAALSSVANLDILEPTVPFPETRSETVPPPAGSPPGTPPTVVTRGNPWPWDSITVANPPAGNQGPGPQGHPELSSFTVGGSDWRFEVTAVDRQGNPTTLRLPMYFRAGTAPIPPGLANAWVAAVAATGIDLAGQPLAMTSVPPPAPLPPHADGRVRPGRAGGGLPLAETATTVLANNLTLGFAADGRPEVTELLARIPSIDAPVRDLVGQAGQPGQPNPAAAVGEVALSYAKAYRDAAYTALNAQGQLFLQAVKKEGKEAVLELGKSAAGGLAAAGLPIGALSASYGTVAGSLDPAKVQDSLTKLASGKVDLSVLTEGVGTLLGLVPLDEIVDLDADLPLDEAQKVVTDGQDGVLTKTILYDVPLFRRDPVTHAVIPFRKGFIELAPRADLTNPKLTVTQTLTADADAQQAHQTTYAEVKGLELKVFYRSDPPANEAALVTVPFKTISASFRDTEKPEIDVKFSAIRFGGLLAFVGVLAELIDDLGLSDPPALEITPTGAKSSFSFQVPTVAVGMFALANVTFATSLELNFATQPAVLLLVEFSSFDHPFRLTVALLGGGGYLRIGAASDGLALIEGSLSFGAAIAVNLGVAAGSVEAMGGVCFRYDRAAQLAEIVAFLRVRGEINVLGLISVSVTLMITLTYDLNRNSLIGEATLVVQVSVLFFSQSVTVPFTWEIAGGNADPTFAELMAPQGAVGELPWDTYCLAYA
ncbi:hypothetical protein GCM10022236_22110 [Microlunatus ginsengisoli]|uniref:Uncharacterized protein n=1 Tax=Microlunatus ginsengisoli TaxID=363863 RepID=A0ABP6ZTM2_9ACTN